MHTSPQIPYVTIIDRSYADNKPKSFNIMRIFMFAILDKAKHETENIGDLNAGAVRHMTALLIKIVLQTELPLIRHNLLYEPGLKRGPIYVVYIYEL
jgi:hypothetical protein